MVLTMSDKQPTSLVAHMAGLMCGYFLAVLAALAVITVICVVLMPLWAPILLLVVFVRSVSAFGKA